MKTKYINKICSWCLKDWYDGIGYVTKTCDFHQKYSYERCVKKIKEEKRDRNKWRIIWGFFISICVIGLILGISQINSGMEAYILIIKSFASLPIIIWTWIQNERDSKRWIKEYEEEKCEWVKYEKDE